MPITFDPVEIPSTLVAFNNTEAAKIPGYTGNTLVSAFANIKANLDKLKIGLEDIEIPTDPEDGIHLEDLYSTVGTSLFESGADGWIAVNANLTWHPEPNRIEISSTTTNPYIYKTFSGIVEGSIYDKIMICVKKISGTATEQKLRWKHAGHDFNDVNYLLPLAFSETWEDGETKILIYDLSAIPDWKSNDITGLRFDLDNTHSSSYHVFYVITTSLLGGILGGTIAASTISTEALKAQINADQAEANAEFALQYKNAAQLFRDDAEDFKDVTALFAQDSEAAKLASEAARDASIIVQNTVEDAQAQIEAAVVNAETALANANQAITDANDAIVTASGYVADALAAKEDAHESALDALSAKTASEAARDLAEIYKNTSQTASSSATTAATNATNAKNLALQAVTDAEAAKTAAENALNSALDAQASAEAAQNLAETAVADIATVLAAAEDARDAAQDAQGLAQSARDAAQDAQNLAETAKNLAQGIYDDTVILKDDTYEYRNEASGFATTATTKAGEASVSASNAATSESNALASKNAAATSATTAANSATAAGNSASAASTSATNAATSASAAGTSATSASNSANTATTKAGEASTSASQAATSATNAAGSASSASTQATNAANSATNAGNSATAASNSASTAATQATNAGNSASAASTSATNAATSASAAGTSAGSASTSATAAANSASNAAGSASSASTQATNAANSATAAGNSASAASTSASQAATSATNAGTSATSASNSATTATTQAGNASTSAGQAATSASDALGYRNQAATYSSTSAQNAIDTSYLSDISKYIDPELTSASFFNGSLNGWTPTNSTFVLSSPAPGGTFTATGSNPYIQKTSLSFDGSRFTKIILNVTYTGTPTLTGLNYSQVYWTTAGHASFNSSYYTNRVFPTGALTQNTDYVIIFDMTSPTAGGNDWVSNTITGLRIQLGTASGHNFKIKSIVVAGPDFASPGKYAQAAATSESAAATSATNAGTYAGAAQTSATNAATSAGNASTSAGSASTSASDALGYRNQASTYATNAATSATNAGNSASAANTSASNAATSATNAATSATAASASANTASTQAGNASTSASSAATSASDALGYRNTASTHASNAATSATNAENSASAASTSASQAATSATNAGSSATSAAASANTATTQAGNASSSASSAATSEANALSYKNAAFSSQTVSANNAEMSQFLNLEQNVSNDFSSSLNGWSAGTNTTFVFANPGGTYTATGSDPKIQKTGISFSGSAYPRIYVNLTYTGTTTLTSSTWDGLCYWARSDYATIDGNNRKVGVLVNNETQLVQNGTYTFVYDMTSPTAGLWLGKTITSIRFDFGSLSGHNFKINYINIVAADAGAPAKSASAAATSASSAATSATNASNSASAASTSATTATTQAGNASTSASAAATSASDALGYRNQSSTYASNAATSATNAGNSATAASNSASTAATNATNAGNSATAAATSATTASTQAGNASTSATNAANSASTATTQANNASQSAGVAATYANVSQFIDGEPSATASFINTNNGWFPTGAATFTTGSTGSVYTQNASGTYLHKTGLSIDGSRYTHLLVEIDYLAGAAAITTNNYLIFYYSTSGHAYNGSYHSKAYFPNPVNITTGSSATLMFDLANLTDGGNDWVSNTITGIRFNIGNSADTTVSYRLKSVSLAARDTSAPARYASAASNSASTASTQATNAATSATAASTSASNAATQAGNASTSASAAATSASDALGYRNTAGTHASNAATSATNAGNSASAASTSASQAATSATNASSSATSASNSANTASTQAGNASTSASAAATSAADALGYRNTASTHASNAATSATNAGNSASAASTSASNAATSATASQVSADAAEKSELRAQLLSSGLTNPGFEFGTIGDTGIPYGYLFNAGNDATAYSLNADVDSNSAHKSTKSFGATSGANWWEIGKRFRISAGTSRTFTVSVKWKNFEYNNIPASMSPSATQTWMGESDIFARIVAYDSDGNTISMTSQEQFSKSLSHKMYDLGITGNQAAAWRLFTHTFNVPNTADIIEVYAVASDGSNAIVNLGTKVAGAQGLMDDFTVFSPSNFFELTDNTQAAITSMRSAETFSNSAATAATAASGSATTASTAATNAGNSASAANTSATNAAASQTAAATSATAANTAKIAAETARDNAASSASAAATSATNAGTSATTASTQAGIAQSNAIEATAMADISRFIDAYPDATTIFNGTVDGWTGFQATLTASSPAPGLNLTATGTDPYITKSGLSFSGSRYTKIIIDLTYLSATTFNPTTSHGQIYYATSGHSWSGSFYKNSDWPVKTSIVQNERFLMIFDMTNLTSGGNDWVSNTITGIRFDPVSAQYNFKIHSIRVVGADTSAPAMSASAAATSASAASASQSAAASSASSASTSATTATTQAGNAATSAGQASTSATNAANSANSASTYSTTAANSATAAGTSATNAANSASAASTSATTASTQATNASNSATAAGTSATNAANSASTATTQANIAEIYGQVAQSTDVHSYYTSSFISTFDNFTNNWQSTKTLLSPGPGIEWVATAVSQCSIGTPYQSLAAVFSGQKYNLIQVRLKYTGSGLTIPINAMQMYARYNNSTTNIAAGIPSAVDSTHTNFTNGTTYTLTWDLSNNATWASRTDINEIFINVNPGGTMSTTNKWEIYYIRLSGPDSTQPAKLASAAAASASSASASQTAAANSATAANSSAVSASSSASTASTQAGNASTSATNAGNSATTAANSATAAGTSATNAATSATNAGNSASAASNSAIVAQSNSEASWFLDAHEITNDFSSTASPWTVSGATSSLASPGWNITPTTNDPQIYSNTISLSGSRYTRAYFDLIWTGTTINFSSLDKVSYWARSDYAPIDGNNRKVGVTLNGETQFVNGGRYTIVFDYASPTAGLWTGKTITNVQFDISNSSTNQTFRVMGIRIVGSNSAAPAISAAAAATSASNASTSATNAGTSASAASTSATNAAASASAAAGSASSASTSANTATTQASNASASAASASTASLVTAKLVSGANGGAWTNTTFENWPGGYASIPPPFSVWASTGGTITKETSDVRLGTNSVKITQTSDANIGVQINGHSGNWTGPTNQQYFMYEADFKLSGSPGNFNGFMIGIRWVNTTPTNYDTFKMVDTILTYQGDGVYSIRELFIRPAGYTGTFNQMYAYFLPRYTTGPNKTVILDRWQIRPATSQEVAVVTETSARIAADGTIEAKYSVKVDVNGYVTGFGLISTANNASPSSTFVVLADNFLVARPGAGGTPIQVFEIGYVNGVAQLVMRGNMFADGTIAGRALAIGTSSSLLLNGDFSANQDFWTSFKYATNTAIQCGFNLNSTYLPTNDSGFILSQTDADTNSYTAIQATTSNGSYYPVTIGQRYEASVYAGLHRAVGYIEIVPLDSSFNEIAGNRIQSTSSASSGRFTNHYNATTNPSLNGGTTWSYFARIGLIFTPTNADTRYIIVRIRKSATNSSTNSYFFGGRAYFGEALPNQTEFSPWSRGAVMIKDGQVTAPKISVTSLSAITANVGTLTAGLLRSTDSKMQIDLDNKRLLIAD